MLSTIEHFNSSLQKAGFFPLKARSIESLQANLGYNCNQTCAHCHVEAGPERTEEMGRDVMEFCAEAIELNSIPEADLTGGAPEFNHLYRWFVERLSKTGAHIKTRTNLTAIHSDAFSDLPRFWAAHGVEVIGSLPCYDEENVDKLRGEGTFKGSIEAMRLLNAEGYGIDGSGFSLNLVYNPAGPFLPPDQSALEADYRRVLTEEHGVEFNRLFAITNMPIGRFAEMLREGGKEEKYLELLASAFNPLAAAEAMCRDMLSVAPDGSLFDCDFNQMLGMGLIGGAPEHIKDFDIKRLEAREIATGPHCYGCSAGAGSSCGGALAEE